jgi:hypothetical protein
VVQVTEDRASPLWHRQRLREIDADTGAVTHIIADVADVVAGSMVDDHLMSIVVEARVDGLPAASIAIPVSADASAAGVMAAAEVSAGKRVVFD